MKFFKYIMCIAIFTSANTFAEDKISWTSSKGQMILQTQKQKKLYRH